MRCAEQLREEGKSKFEVNERHPSKKKKRSQMEIIEGQKNEKQDIEYCSRQNMNFHKLYRLHSCLED